MHARSGGADPGRDGCRVPMPWAADDLHCGFGVDSEPRLPQRVDWADYAADRQAREPGSMLALYREALSLRRSGAGFGDGPLPGSPRPKAYFTYPTPAD